MLTALAFLAVLNLAGLGAILFLVKQGRQERAELLDRLAAKSLHEFKALQPERQAALKARAPILPKSDEELYLEEQARISELKKKIDQSAATEKDVLALAMME